MLYYRRMLCSLSTLCTFYTPIVSVALRAVVGKGNLTQAPNPTGRGVADAFIPISEETGPALWADSNPSFDATGQDIENSPDVSLEQDIGSSLGPYNNVSFSILDRGFLLRRKPN